MDKVQKNLVITRVTKLAVKGKKDKVVPVLN
jgi:hypothetical protein